MARLLLGRRDINFFIFLHTSKAATSKQIHREVFGKALTNFYKKMRLYRKLKLVNRLTGADSFNSCGVFELTKKGFNIVRANKKSVIHHRYRSNSILHDLFLVEIRHILRGRNLVMHYLTENQIQTSADFDTEKGLVDFKRLHCDALMVVKSPKNDSQIKVALEFELSDKSMNDYRKKLSDYYNSGSIHAVLFICKDSQTEARIKKVESEINKSGKHRAYFLRYEMLQEATLPIIFEAQDGSIVQV